MRQPATRSPSSITQQPLDLRRLHQAYAEGLESAALIDEIYRRIQALDDPGIFLTLLDAEAVKQQAEQLGAFDPQRWPLWGVPFAIKDNIDAADTVTTAACPAFAYQAGKDAEVVRRLRAAGALLIGKTNLDQFATGLVGTRTPYPVPRNAIDPELVPGGSSSGSAVAVARGLVSFTLGTDTAGSGRVPAALNNIVGLKPSLGALSTRGVVPACRSLDCVSVFALTVEDAWSIFETGCAFDAQDPWSRPTHISQPQAPRSGLRVGIPDSESLIFFGDSIQQANWEQSLTVLRAQGAELVPLDLGPFFETAQLLYTGPWVAERLAASESLLRRQPEAILPVTREIIAAADNYSALNAFQGQYRLAELRRAAGERLSSVDLLAVPSIPRPVSLSEIAADPLGHNSQLGTYTNFVNLLDLCALTLPVAARSDGKPGGGLTLIAAREQDGLINGLAQAIQQASHQPLGATGWTLPASEARPPQAADDEIALAVVGAHMSGLPLNRELTERGARFLFAGHTAPSYRLYSLPGGPPFRPGLVESDKGERIALEVWAIPQTRFGEFLRGVPKPLCIGTLRLDDGQEVKGFLCEALATREAQDITHLGGWRAWLAQPVAVAEGA